MAKQAVLQISKDNPAKFTLIYREYWPILCKYALRYTRNTAEAEDLVTDVFIRFLNQPRSFNNLVAVRAFLRTCVFHACVNYSIMRKRKDKNDENLRIFLRNEREDYALAHLIRKEAGRDLLAAIETIPARARKVCKMLYLKGMNQDQVAEQLHLSRNTVKSHRASALKVLRRKFPRRELLLS